MNTVSKINVNRDLDRRFGVEIEVTQTFVYHLDADDAFSEESAEWQSNLYDRLCTMFDSAPSDLSHENHIVPAKVCRPVDEIISENLDQITRNAEFIRDNSRLVDISQDSYTEDRRGLVEIETCFSPGYVYKL